MLVQADLHVQSSLMAYFKALRADSGALNSIFAGLSEAQRTEIRKTFATLSIPIKLGYPIKAAELPGVYVTLGGMTEATTGIGETFGDEETPLRFIEQRGAIYQHVIRLQCYALNADLTCWLQNVVFAGLWAMRANFTAHRFAQQQLSVSDFLAAPQLLPDIAYRRDVILTAQIELSIPIEVLKIVNIEITATPVDAAAQPTKIYRL